MLHHTAMICSAATFDIDEATKSKPDFKYGTAPVIGDAS